MIPKFSRLRVFSVTAVILSLAFFLAFKSGLISNAEPKPLAALLAPAITATNNDALVNDVDGDGIADPGDTIEYTVTINNGAAVGAGNDALNMIFTDTLDANMTLVPGSVSVSPIAADDAFSVYGNVSISIPDGASDLLGNDVNPNTGNNTGLTATAETKSSANCAGCNNVTINANGSFSYDPPVGFTGADSFSYTLNGPGGTTSTGTVTLNVSGMIWFINNAAAACTTLAGQCGKLSKPFSSLDAFRAVNLNGAGQPGNNHNVFIYQSATGYTLPLSLTMLSGQKFIGQDAAPNGTVISDPALFNITLPSFSAGLPVTDTGGTTVSISGNTVFTANNNTLRGVTLGSLTTLDGTNFGTLTVSDVIINTNTRALNLQNGAVTGTGFTSITSTSVAGGLSNISLTTVTGTVNLGGGALSGASGTAFLVSGGTGAITYGGTISKTSAGLLASIGSHATGNITLSGNLTCNAGCTGINASNNTSGTIAFSGATKTINTGTNPAVTLSGNTGATINFSNGGLNIDTTSGKGLNATGGGTIIIGTGANANTIDSTTGTAVEIVGTSAANRMPLNIQLTSVSASGGASGIILNNTSSTGSPGGFRINGTGATDGSGGTIQNMTGDGVTLTNTAFVILKNMIIGDSTAVQNQPPDAVNNIGGDGIGMNNADDSTLDNLKIARTGAHGIDGTGVTNLTVSNSEFFNNGDGNDENAMAFNDAISFTENNLDGTVTITDTNFDGFHEDGIQIENFAGTLNLTVSGSRFANNDATFGENGIRARADGTSNLTLTVNDSVSSQALFDVIDGNSIAVFSDTPGSTANVTVNSVTITGSLNPADGNAIGIVLFGGEGNFNFTLTNNTITNAGATGISIQPNGDSNMQGTVSGNTVNGTGSGRGIEVLSDDTSDGIVNISSNNVSNAFCNAIFASNQNTGDLDITIRNNTGGMVASPCSGLASHVIEVNVRETSTNCLDIANNNAIPTGAGNVSFRTRQRDTSLFRMERLGANTNNTATVEAFLLAQNGNNAGETASATVSTTYTAVADGACQNPSSLTSFNGFSYSNDPALGYLNSLENVPTNLVDLNGFYNKEAKVTKTEKDSTKVIIETEGKAATIKTSYFTPDVHKILNTLSNASNMLFEISGKLSSAISPRVYSQAQKEEIPVSISGETITVGSPGGFTLPASKSVTIKFRATIDNVPGLTQVSNQGTVSGSNFSNVLTDDAAVGGGADPTVTLVDTTSVSVSSSQNPSVVGQSVTFTATLTGVPAHASGNPSGTVEFFEDGNSIGTAPAMAGAVNTSTATLAVSNLPAGSHTITATYSGGGQFNAGTGSMTGNPQVISNTAVWDGSASSDWNTAANWTTNFAPLAGNDVSIPSAGVTNNPTISATDITVNSLNEASGRILTINSGRMLTVTGACTINGTLTVAGAFSCGSFAGTGTVNFTGAAAQNIPALTYQNLTINNASGVNLSGNVTVNGVLNLTNGNVNTGVNVLTIGTSGSITRTTGHIIGDLEKFFGATGAFTYPTGTATGYSPVMVNITNLAVNPSSLKVKANDGTAPANPPLNDAVTLDRFWTLTETGDLRADVTFNYLQADVDGDEASYLTTRVEGMTAIAFPNFPPCPGGGSPCVDPAGNTIFVANVEQFSDWTAGETAPLAANVEVSGRVLTSTGRGIFNAEVAMTNFDGEVITARTNPFGYFRFTGVGVGESYVFRAKHKLYEFTPQLITINESRDNILIVANSKQP